VGISSQCIPILAQILRGDRQFSSPRFDLLLGQCWGYVQRLSENAFPIGELKEGKWEETKMRLEIPENLLSQLNQIAQLSETLKGFSTEMAQLKENDGQVAKLKDKIAEMSDPAKLREKLQEIASTWTEDEYRQLGEALDFSTPLIPQ
jgi:hypothetical protein